MKTMADIPDLITAQDLEAMTAAERATTLSEAVITDLDTLDEHTVGVVARGRDRILKRFHNLNS